MRVSAKADYAVRAAVELAARDNGAPVKAQVLAEAQDIPLKFLENILQALRQSGIVHSVRGPQGGHQLARPADEISVADVVRAIEGPLAAVAGRRPEDLEFGGPAVGMRDVWIAVRANLRAVLEHVTLAEVASGRVPKNVKRLTADPDAWARR